MVPAHTSVDLQFVGLLIVEVHAHHLIGCQTLTTTTETAATATTAGEAHIVGVVGICHKEHLKVVLHHTTEDTTCIAVLGTCGKVGIGHDTFVHTSLDTEIEYRFLLTVLDT